ncbi:MAG: histidine phosphotransferase family protein [Alphaproteobacteria bacterium]|nr:histidine phosphotransferase family protein [Alphaproteobacteria bacterium]
MNETELFIQACTRMCHDLAGVSGIINNGLEMAAESAVGGKIAEKDLEMVRAPSRILADRLKFFRAILGRGGAVADLKTAQETAAAYVKTLENQAASFVVDFASVPSDPQRLRMALIAVMIAANSLIRGGRISVQGDSQSVNVTGSGAMIKLSDESEKLLNGQDGILDPHTAICALLRHFTAMDGGSVKVVKSDESISLFMYF